MMASGLILCLIVFVSMTSSNADPNEARLIHDLMKNYSVLERPVKNDSQTVNVTVGIILLQIIDMNERDQTIDINTWIKYEWSDYKLKWKPDQYGGINDIRLPISHIWKPDIVLYNSADSNFDNSYPIQLIVYPDGSVNWISPTRIRSSCRMNMKWFPFDDQSCTFVLGSWTHSGLDVDVTPASELGMDISEYITSPEFSLLSAPVKKSVKYYACCPEPYPNLEFSINLRRRILYYGFNLFLPMTLIIFMTFLALILHPNTNEKVPLEIVILFYIFYFQSFVASAVPPNSETVPLIGIFFIICMIILVVSLIFTIVYLNIRGRGKEQATEMNKITKAILLTWLPKFLLMNNLEDNNTNQKREMSIEEEEELLTENKNPGEDRGSLTRANQIDPDKHALSHQVNHVLKQLKIINTNIASPNCKAATEWRHASIVIDRLCVVVFSVALIVNILVFIIAAPHFFT